MSPTVILYSCFIILLSSTAPSHALAAAAGDDDTPTAYDLLQAYNFPEGILPKGVISYDLDNSTGKFHAYLNGTCSFKLEGSYQIKYKSTISGTIKKNKIKDLSGISVKVLFLWLNIVEVTRSDDELEFSVGIASANYPIENFLECPQCGCGLDCNNVQGGMRGYMCEHNTSPPENQVIKTNQTNILIRSLTIKKDGKATPSTEVSKKRAALPMDGKSKRAMTNSRQEGSSTRTPVKEFLGLTVERLRALLKDRGLSTKGKKDELIARLKSS